TRTDLHYVGSLTLDRDPMDSVNLISGKKLDAANINNGARVSTYVLEGSQAAGITGSNGAAACLMQSGGQGVIIAYYQVTDEEARALQSRPVFVNDDNHIGGLGTDLAEPGPGSGMMCGDEVSDSR